jgi:signal transduction histidine kinase
LFFKLARHFPVKCHRQHSDTTVDGFYRREKRQLKGGLHLPLGADCVYILAQTLKPSGLVSSLSRLMTSRTKTRTEIIFFISACGVAAVFLMLFSFLAQLFYQMNTASCITLGNAIGQQQNLAWTIYHYAGMVAAGQEEDKDALLSFVADFDQRLQILQKGGKMDGLYLTPEPQEIADELPLIREKWESVKALAITIAELPAGDSTAQAAFQQLRLPVQRLSESWRQAVAVLEQKIMNERKRTLLATAVLGALSLTSMIVGFWLFKGYLAARRETERKLQQAHDQLEQRVKERTGELEKSLAQLKRKNAELDEFTFVASHDLREPLRKIIAFSDLLRKDLGNTLSDNARTDLEYIVDAAQRMQTLIDHLLMLSRAGSRQLKKERVPLRECVDAALDALHVLLKEKNVEIVCDALPEVMGDRTMLTQLYQNLIGNAVKFNHQPRPRVHLTAETNGDRIILGVKDNGIGIKPDYVDKIFAPFKRLHGRGEYEGTGIGLAICRKVVERHGGSIWVESQPGEGAHFKFTLDETYYRAKEVQPCSNATENLPSSCLPRMTPAIRR